MEWNDEGKIKNGAGAQRGRQYWNAGISNFCKEIKTRKETGEGRLNPELLKC